jgi:hypothetical protein
MTLTLEISPELEEALRATASRQGLPLDRYVLNVLEERVVREMDWTENSCPAGGPPVRRPPGDKPERAAVLPRVEAELLQKINEGLPEATWERYRSLKAKRDAEALTEEEHAELLRLVNEIELRNARRLEVVGELARLRGVRLPDLVKQLGLMPSPDA